MILDGVMTRRSPLVTPVRRVFPLAHQSASHLIASLDENNQGTGVPDASADLEIRFANCTSPEAGDEFDGFCLLSLFSGV
jgi:hypothetical protein